MLHAISIRNLAKRYQSGSAAVDALSGVDLEIPSGQVFGLLGPNGAGKSTLLRILTGLVQPSSGQVQILGQDLSPTALANVGALVEAPSFYPYLTGLETLQMMSRLQTRAGNKPDDLLERVGLSSASSRRVSTYSLGMKQRLAIATALISDPPIIVLDEPTNGMDPAGIRDIRRLVRELCDGDGKTVLLSSHLLDEVERTCDRVAILRDGRVVAQESLAARTTPARLLRIDASPVEQVLITLDGRATCEDGFVFIKVERTGVPALLAALMRDGVEIFETRWMERDFEELYFATTGTSR